MYEETYLDVKDWVTVLGRMALSLYKPGAPGRVQPREITEMTGSPRHGAAGAHRLSDQNIVATDEGGYFVPIGQLDRAIAIVVGVPAAEAA